MSSRRIFMQQAGLIAAGLMLNPSDIFSRARTNTVTKIGIQLFTLRDQLTKDVRDTLQRVAKTGYDHVETYFGYQSGEPAKFWGLEPKELKTLLADNKLTTHSGHYQLEDFLTRGNGNDEALKFQLDIAATLGQKYLVVPVPPRALMEKMSGADFQFMASQLNKAGELAKKSGLKVGYHNHFWEFKQLPDIKGTGYDILLKDTDPSLVALELDIFWAEKSGIDPVTLFKAHPGRFAMWHVKDVDKSAPGKIVGPEEDAKPLKDLMGEIRFAEVGTGVVDFKKIFANASEAGVKYAFVEQDQISIDPFVSIKKSYDYVKANLLKR